MQALMTTPPVILGAAGIDIPESMWIAEASATVRDVHVSRWFW